MWDLHAADWRSLRTLITFTLCPMLGFLSCLGGGVCGFLVVLHACPAGEGEGGGLLVWGRFASFISLKSNPTRFKCTTPYSILYQLQHGSRRLGVSPLCASLWLPCFSHAHMDVCVLQKSVSSTAAPSSTATQKPCGHSLSFSLMAVFFVRLSVNATQSYPSFNLSREFSRRRGQSLGPKESMCPKDATEHTYARR